MTGLVRFMLVIFIIVIGIGLMAGLAGGDYVTSGANLESTGIVIENDIQEHTSFGSKLFCMMEEEGMNAIDCIRR